MGVEVSRLPSMEIDGEWQAVRVLLGWGAHTRVFRVQLEPRRLNAPVDGP